MPKCKPPEVYFKEVDEKFEGLGYEYKKEEYLNSESLLSITCPSHGVFHQKAGRHLQRDGCPQCGWDAGRALRVGSKAMLEERGRIVHADIAYDYSDVVYVNANTKVTINCPNHGPFQMTPGNHLNGSGCSKCFREREKAAKTLTLAEAIQRGKDRHSERYSYNPLQAYDGSNSKLEITCTIHGIFLQHAGRHWEGRGCPCCATSGYNRAKPGTFYILVAEGCLKVGITNKKMQTRLNNIRKSSCIDFSVHTTVFSEDGNVAFNLEKQALGQLRANYKIPETKFDGYTECFLGADVADVLLLIDNKYVMSA